MVCGRHERPGFSAFDPDPTERQGAVVVSVHKTPQTVDRDKQAVVLGVLPEMEGLIDWFHGVALPLDNHLFLIPDAKLLVVLPCSHPRTSSSCVRSM